MNLPYSKPHLSVPAQLAQLKSRGMLVGDEPRAERYLARLGYYRLSGYWYPARTFTRTRDATGKLLLQAEDTFRPGTTFERAVDLYIFDKRLRLLFLDALERIEVNIRVEAAILLTARDPLAHRNAAELHGNFTKKTDPKTGRTRHAEWLVRLDEATNRSKEDFVQRFLRKYSTPLPMWIAIELWDFGTLSHFISGMRYDDANKLAAKFGIPSGDLLMSWVRSLNQVRNVCAHHSRLWNRVSTDLPKAPPRGAVPDLDHVFADGKTHNKVYAAAAITRHFMRIISPQSAWALRLNTLIASFPAGPGIGLRQSGFPKDWDKLTLWTQVSP